MDPCISVGTHRCSAGRTGKARKLARGVLYGTVGATLWRPGKDTQRKASARNQRQRPILFARWADCRHPRSCRGVVLPRPGSFPVDWRLGWTFPGMLVDESMTQPSTSLAPAPSPRLIVPKLRSTEPCHSTNKRLITAHSRSSVLARRVFNLGQPARAGFAVHNRGKTGAPVCSVRPANATAPAARLNLFVPDCRSWPRLRCPLRPKRRPKGWKRPGLSAPFRDASVSKSRRSTCVRNRWWLPLFLFRAGPTLSGPPSLS